MGRGTTIVVAGCVAQAEGTEIGRRQPAVDLVVGRKRIIGCRSDRARPPPGRRAWRPIFRSEDKFDRCRRRARRGGVTAFVTVQEGCDKFCSFCVVPYTRGAEYSRPPAEVIEEKRARSPARRARGHPARPERQRLR